jgi:hypothetical protein
MTAPKFNDRYITDGFPEGWHVQDRLDDNTALLCRTGNAQFGLALNVCVCVRPRAISTDEWIPTAMRLAHGYARADLHRAEVEAAVVRALEACDAECAELLKSFASPEYTTGQPMASFGERFAVGRCIEKIRAIATDPAALARIIEDGPGMRALGDAGRRTALARFHPDIVARRTAGFYREIMCSR